VNQILEEHGRPLTDLRNLSPGACSTPKANQRRREWAHSVFKCDVKAPRLSHTHLGVAFEV